MEAIISNADLIPELFLALVVVCFMLGCKFKKLRTSYSETSLSIYLSALFPINMKGNLFG